MIGPTPTGRVFDTWQSSLFTWFGPSIGTALSAGLMPVIMPRKKG
jgi:hypothetical protein